MNRSGVIDHRQAVAHLRSAVIAFAIVIIGFRAVAEDTGTFETGVPDDAPVVVTEAEPSPAMTLSQVITLGIVEGLTEYLPISSTGHLILAQRAMGLGNSDVANAYAICIQAGAIGAVLMLYFGRIRQMFRGCFGRDEQGSRIAVNILVAFLPAAVVGGLFARVIEDVLFGAKPIIAAWFIGGLAILIVARWQKNSSPSGRELEDLTWKMALVIGLAQCLALWPGTSRSLATIVSGVLVGLSLPAAVEFSFLLGVLTLGAATVYKSLEHGSSMVQVYGWTHLAVGAFVATVSAMVAVKWMVTYLNRHSLAVFGYYRLLLAVAVGSLVVMGKL